MYSANTVSTQINVTGWKQIYSNGGFTIVSNGILAELTCNYTANLTAWQTITTIPYPPAHTQTFPYSMGTSDYTKTLVIETDGRIRSKYTASNVTVEGNVLYRLANPLY